MLHDGGMTGRIVKGLIGVALIPIDAALTWAVGMTLIRAGASTSLFSIPAGVWGLSIGVVVGFALLALLPPSWRGYVWAHELTHALWGALGGARVSGLRVTGRGGSVRLSWSNCWVTLAPYFFPFYTVLIAVAYIVLSLFFDLRPYAPLWMGWIGLSWAYHVYFTIHAIRQGQPDIREHGRLFSYALIYGMHLLLMGVAMALFTPGRIGGLLGHWLHALRFEAEGVVRLVKALTG